MCKGLSNIEASIMPKNKRPLRVVEKMKIKLHHNCKILHNVKSRNALVFMHAKHQFKNYFLKEYSMDALNQSSLDSIYGNGI